MIERCNHDDCLRDGPMPGCWSYQAYRDEELNRKWSNVKKGLINNLGDAGIQLINYLADLLDMYYRKGYVAGKKEQKRSNEKVMRLCNCGVLCDCDVPVKIDPPPTILKP